MNWLGDMSGYLSTELEEIDEVTNDANIVFHFLPANFCIELAAQF